MVQVQMNRIEEGPYIQRQDIDGVQEWIVEELHDGVAQSLWFLGTELSALNREIPSNEAGLRAQVETLGQVAQEAYDQVRAILGHAWVQDKSGQALDDVVQQEVETFEERTGVAVGLTLEPVSFQVSSWQAHHIAAILREALSNAWRHGQAQRVQVELTATEGTMSLTVIDRGAGFDCKDLREGHYGLATMRRRAHEALNGTIEVVSKPGSGTQVSLTFPAWSPTN